MRSRWGWNTCCVIAAILIEVHRPVARLCRVVHATASADASRTPACVEMLDEVNAEI